MYLSTIIKRIELSYQSDTWFFLECHSIIPCSNPGNSRMHFVKARKSIIVLEFTIFFFFEFFLYFFSENHMQFLIVINWNCSKIIWTQTLHRLGFKIKVTIYLHKKLRKLRLKNRKNQENNKNKIKRQITPFFRIIFHMQLTCFYIKNLLCTNLPRYWNYVICYVPFSW